MITYDLKGRAALVTGGASGIGLATATLLARSGCAVAINHLADDPRGPEAVAKLAAETGARVISAPGSVADAAGAAAMVEKAVADLGRLDYLANNAGTPGTRTSVAPHELDRLTEELWQAVIEVNLLGVFRCAKAAAPALRASRGAIVNTASIAGLRGSPGLSGYSISKHAVVGLTRSAAKELAPLGVRVNAVCPGPIDTAMGQQLDSGVNPQDPAAGHAKVLTQIPAGRYGQPDEVAALVAFLLSREAAYISGATYPIDGAMTA